MSRAPFIREFDITDSSPERKQLDELISQLCGELYSAYFSGGTLSINSFAREKGLDGLELRKLVASLEVEGILTTEGSGVSLTALGVVHCEENGIGADKRGEYNDLRYRIVKFLEAEYNEHGPGGGSHLDPIAKDLGVDRAKIYRQVRLLDDLGLVDGPGSGFLRLTQGGVAQAQSWIAQKGRNEELDRIAGLDSASRGREFQKTFANALEEAGWGAVKGLRSHSLRSSTEEIDIFVSRGREYYLVECEWLEDPVEADVVRELYGKIKNRAGVQGVLASMSSFTQGASEAVEGYAKDRLILLFGETDVRSIIDQPANFESLLENKIGALVIPGEVLFE